MLKINRLKNKDLEIFNNKKIVIYSYSHRGKELYEILDYLGYDVIAFCSTSIRHTINIGYKGVPILSFYRLSEMIRNSADEIIVQLDSFEVNNIEQLKDNLKDTGVQISNISLGNLVSSFDSEIVLNKIEKNHCKKDYQYWKYKCNRKMSYPYYRFLRKKGINPVIICLPMKTGDFTLNTTFDLINKYNKKFSFEDRTFGRMIKEINDFIFEPIIKKNNSIEYINITHKAIFLKKIAKVKSEKVKVITAIREPISQNLSSFYQCVDAALILKDWIYGEVENAEDADRAEVLNKLNHTLVQNGDNVQILFEQFIKRYIYNPKNLKSMYPKSIQAFIAEFKESMMDITVYPFNKEKGYTIIKEGNIEVFVYQLEKLNDLVPELSEWMEVSFEKLEKGNVASDKWIGESYKQALQEIEITQEYFDRCYSEPYVQHCYSQEDIEKFKARWRPHIKKES